MFVFVLVGQPTTLLDVPNDRQVNNRYSTQRVRTDYAHVGLYDVKQKNIWVAKKRRNMPAIRVSHARMLVGGTQDTSTSKKDRFVCYWFHTPGTGQGYVLGYPIEWGEGHLMVRLDPYWDYVAKRMIASTDTTKAQRSIDQQFEWGRRIFEIYLAANPKFPLSWHLVGPRATDSLFYIKRVDSG